MRWPWQRSERRQAGGFTDTIVSAFESGAAVQVADVGRTAALEAAAGALSRALSIAEVEGPEWVREACNPVWLGQVGRDLIRRGASLSVVSMSGGGEVELIPAGFWNFETTGGNTESERSWSARVTTYGPSVSSSRVLPRDRMVFVRWGSSSGSRYLGQGPTSWASLTAKTASESERSLGDESAGALAQLLAVPDDPQDDTLTNIKAAILKARGNPVLLESTQGAWGDGLSASPQRDWKAARLGPEPTAAMVQLARDSFDRVLASCGMAPALFNDADGTSQREALRRFHLNTVRPLARILEHELSLRFDVPVTLGFDLYNVDLQARATAFKKLVESGMEVEKAAGVSGVLAAE